MDLTIMQNQSIFTCSGIIVSLNLLLSKKKRTGKRDIRNTSPIYTTQKKKHHI